MKCKSLFTNLCIFIYIANHRQPVNHEVYGSGSAYKVKEAREKAAEEAYYALCKTYPNGLSLPEQCRIISLADFESQHLKSHLPGFLISFLDLTPIASVVNIFIRLHRLQDYILSWLNCFPQLVLVILITTADDSFS